MADLTGQQLKDSYQNLVTIDATIESNPTSGQLENGLGNPITALGIGTDSPSATLEINGGVGKVFTIDQGTSNRTQLKNDRGIELIGQGGYPAVIKGLGNAGFGHIVFETSNNGEVARIDSSGNVGIGETNPTSKLSIKGAQAAIDITRGTSGDSKWGFSSDSTSLYIAELSTGVTDYVMTFEETTGNVGIGETNPLSKVHIEDTTGATLTLGNSQSPNDVVSGTVFGRMNFFASDRSSPISNVSGGVARIEAIADGGFSGTSPSSLLFYTHNNTANDGTVLGNPTERMRIDSSGNVGIGTDSPLGIIDASWGGYRTTEKKGLVIGADIGANTSRTADTRKIGMFASAHYDNGDEIALMRIDSDASASELKIGGTSELRGATSIQFNIASTITAQPSPAMTIDSSGQVGIGVTSVTSGVTLDVAGTIKGGIANRKGTYTDGDTTPSVAGISYLRILNTGATTITDFDDAVDGQVIYLEFANSNTTVNRSNAYLSGGTNFTGSANDMLVLFYSGSTSLWHEISRSVNS